MKNRPKQGSFFYFLFEGPDWMKTYIGVPYLGYMAGQMKEQQVKN